MRFFFAIHQGIKNRRALRVIVREEAIAAPVNIPLLALKQSGVRVLIWDFDGILASHGEIAPHPSMLPLLQQSVVLFEMVFILSNKPMPAREQYFSEHFPRIQFIRSPRKKPYPDGIALILDQTIIPAKAHCLVDDRILTGVLATKLAGIRVAYCREPFYDLKKRPIRECFFMLLRYLERRFF